MAALKPTDHKLINCSLSCSVYAVPQQPIAPACQLLTSSDMKKWFTDSTNTKVTRNCWGGGSPGYTGGSTLAVVSEYKGCEERDIRLKKRVCDFKESARQDAGENYKYKPAACMVGNLQPGWSRFHSSKCHLSKVLAYYDLSSLCSCSGISCSLTAGPPTHNWLGSRSISASRPSLMLASLAYPTPPPLCLPIFFLPLFSSASSFLSLSLLPED